MGLELDHLVVAARTLEEGVAWIEERVGVAMGPGGKHATMGTHNRLLSLGPGRFLEVIAIDPEAPPPGRARWFTLDEPATRARLERRPALLHWVVRTNDIEGALRALGGERPAVLDLARGDYRWRIGVPENGALALAGTFPTVIQWRGSRPSEALPGSGCRLESLRLRHARAPGMLDTLRAAGLARDEPVEALVDGEGLEASISTPRGTVPLAGIGPTLMDSIVLDRGGLRDNHPGLAGSGKPGMNLGKASS